MRSERRSNATARSQPDSIAKVKRQAKKTADIPTLADLLARRELTCSAAHVAAWLNVSKPTVIAAAKRGELPGKAIGKQRQWRFSTIALAREWGVDIPEGVSA